MSPGTGPMLSQAFELSNVDAQGEIAAVSELVTYRIGGHRPLGGDSNGVTTPPALGTLRTSPGVRLFVDGGGMVCIHSWRVSATRLDSFDGRQEAGASWRELGAGTGQGDAVVVGGVEAGTWMLHVHLEYGMDGMAEPDTVDGYATVAAGVPGAKDAPVPAPALVAACGDSVTQLSAPPSMVLSTDGVNWTAGTMAVQVEGITSFSAMPSPVVPVAAGALLRVRTADGSCGNDWGSMAFAPVPDDAAAIGAGGSGLPSNNGSDPGAIAIQPLGGVNALAPAHGEWLLSAVFWFGDRFATTYVWHIAVH